jgi:hypothetical protein
MGIKNSGFITWPTHMHNTGEGGMYVLAVVLDHSYLPLHQKQDNFVHCHGPGFRIPHEEVLIGAAPTQPFDFEVKNDTEIVTPRLLACVTLGTSSGSWFDEATQAIWECDFSALTDKGQAFVESLSRLYDNRTVYLLTYLDT